MARKMRQMSTSASALKLATTEFGSDISSEVNNMNTVLSDSCLEILLNIQEAGSDTSSFNETKRKNLGTSVDNFLKIFKRVLLLCKLRLKAETSNQVTRDLSRKSVGAKAWKLNVEFQERDLFYKKGVVCDVNTFMDDGNRIRYSFVFHFS